VKVREGWKRFTCYYCLRKELGHDVFVQEGDERTNDREVSTWKEVRAEPGGQHSAVR